MPNRIIRDAILDSEKYDALQIEARLAFFEILLRADDYGLIPLHNLWLRRHCPVFDARSAEFAEGVLSALADQDLIRVYTHDGKRFAFIPQFGNRPQAIAPKYPMPPATLTNGAIEEAQRQAKNLPRTLKRQAERNQQVGGVEQGSNRVPTGLESPETETETETEEQNLKHTRPIPSESGPGDLAVIEKPAIAKPPPCPYGAIVAAYHELVPVGTRCVDLTATRKEHMAARWRQVWSDERFDQAGGLEFFRRFFAKVGASKFLNGQTPTQPGRRPFLVSLPWLMGPENFLKVIEGRYS